jgi:hypothetical protein
MKALHVLLFAAACGGPSQKDLAETPTATTRPRPAQAPPASTSDEDRAGLVQSFDDMQATQNARQEAQSQKKPASTGPIPSAQPAPAPATAKKKGVAEQGYLPAKK